MNALGLFTFLLALPSFSKTEDQNCNSDDDCGEDSRCDHKVCKNCFSCKILFRKGEDCVHDLKECGECLNGYEDVLVTDTSVVLKPCRPSKNNTICWSNETCSYNMYCLEGTCVSCFDCQLVNRKSPSDGCAKQLEDCGNCLLGFYEVPITIGFNVKPCEKRPIIPPGELNTSSVLFESNIALAFMVIILTVWFAVWFSLKNSKRAKSSLTRIFTVGAREMVEPSAPPLCKPFYPSDSPVCVKSEMKEVSSYHIVNEGRQTAKVFKLPDAPYYDNEAERLIEGNNEGFEDTTDDSGTPTHADNSSNNNTACASSQLVNEVVDEVDQSIDHRIEGDVLDYAGLPSVNSDETASTTSHPQNASEENSIDD